MLVGGATVPVLMELSAVESLLDETAAAVAEALAGISDWGPAGTIPGQYRSDLVADGAALAVLDAANVGVLSEESGLRRAESPLLVIVDPVDGSTNASRGIPWFAISLCAVDAVGPLAALVVNLATGERFDAVRGGGARRNGQPIGPSSMVDVSSAIVGISGFPLRPLGWRQFRALGAAALDLCSVACGRLDAYVDCSVDAHGVWDYAGGMLVCQEAGAVVSDAFDRELIVRDPSVRRTPVAAATPALHAHLRSARNAAVADGNA